MAFLLVAAAGPGVGVVEVGPGHLVGLAALEAEVVVGLDSVAQRLLELGLGRAGAVVAQPAFELVVNFVFAVESSDPGCAFPACACCACRAICCAIICC